MEVSLNTRDINLLIINLLTLRIFTQMPMAFIKTAQFAASLTTLLGGSFSIFVIFLIARFLLKHISGNILDAAQSVFGTAGKIIASSLLFLYLVLSAVFTLSDFSKLIALIAFPTSPMWYICGFLILGAVIGALGNLRAVIRLHGFFVPLILIVFALLLIFTIFPFGSADTTQNAPQNLSPSINNLLSQISLYGDILLLFLIAPTKESRKYLAKKIGYSGICSLALNTLFILAFTLKIPASVAQNGQFPVYLLMKEVYFGRFFQRLDAMILLIAALSAMLYLALNLKLSSSVLHQGFCLAQNRIIPAVLGISVLFLALNEWIFPSGSLQNLVQVFGIGGLAILIVIAIFAEVRRLINEKH